MAGGSAHGRLGLRFGSQPSGAWDKEAAFLWRQLWPDRGSGAAARTDHPVPAGAGVGTGSHWIDGRAFRGYAGSSQANSAWGGSRAGAKVAGSAASPGAVSTLRARWVSTTNAVTGRRPRNGQARTASAHIPRNSSAYGTRPARVGSRSACAVRGSVWSSRRQPYSLLPHEPPLADSRL